MTEANETVSYETTDAFPFNPISKILKFKEHLSEKIPKLKVSHSNDEIEYNMNHRERGRALIFNHENFKSWFITKRDGTDADCKRLKETLEELGFSVEVYNDFKKREVFTKIEEVAKDDHTHRDCLAIAIMSHGEKGSIYTHDSEYKIDELIEEFTADKCKTLAGKPKLFFIQACQGRKVDSGGNAMKSRTSFNDTTKSYSYVIPVYADYLIAYSTVSGYVSYRNTKEGSWFIQTLCDELKENGKEYDILTLMTLVNRRVAYDFKTVKGKKQMPCITSMLTGFLTFKNKTNETLD